MKKYFISLLILTSTYYQTWAQDPACAGIDEGKSPISVGEKTFITADFLNGSSTAFQSTTTVQWLINTPPCIEIRGTGNYFFDDANAANYVDVTVTAYDPVDGQLLQITSKPGVAFPGGLIGAWNITFDIFGKTEANNQPYSIQAISNPLVGTNNTGNDNVGQSISVVGVLPVSILDFSAVAKTGNAVLNWNVTQEINAHRYEVEHSINGNNFNKVGTVTATNAKTYNFTHNNPITGANYYRLRIADLDGKINYSGIRKVSFESNGKIVVYPLPASTVINIVVADNAIGKAAQLKLTDMMGRLVQQEQIRNLNRTESISVGLIPNGIYYLNLRTDNGTEFKQLISVQH